MDILYGVASFVAFLLLFALVGWLFIKPSEVGDEETLEIARRIALWHSDSWGR